MTTNHIIITLIVLLSSVLTTAAQYTDFPGHPEILSFEEGTAPVRPLKKSSVSTSPLHFKLGENSLLWKWKKGGAGIEIPGEIPYLHKNPNPKETSVSTFVFWVYSETPLDGELTFSFMKGDRVCCSFRYGLGFKGWRGAWVAFDRDMEGTPEEGMDKVVITAPEEVRKGRLFLDGIITAAFEDIRHHTADFQAPYINKGTTSHWLVLLDSWNRKLDIEPEAEISAKDVQQMEEVRERFISLVTDGRKALNREDLIKQFDSYGIRWNKDGTIAGKPVFFTRYGETYINIGIPDASRTFSENGQLLRPANDFMFNLALAYLRTDDAEWKEDLEDMYITMTRFMLDQGYAVGSALGTLHHLGYSMRNFYTAPVIMKDVLEREGLSDEMQQAMEWFSGVGEVKTAPEMPGMDIDAFNTSLMGRMASLLMASPRRQPCRADGPKTMKSNITGMFFISWLRVSHRRGRYIAISISLPIMNWQNCSGRNCGPRFCSRCITRNGGFTCWATAGKWSRLWQDRRRRGKSRWPVGSSRSGNSCSIVATR